MLRLLLLLMLTTTPPAGALAQQPTTDDSRQLVTMPVPAQAAMRGDMLDHLAALNEILGYIGEGKWDIVAETAEKRLGESTMGKHGAALRGQGPGRFMPDTMRSLGWTMHSSASRLAKIAKEGDTAKTLAALQEVTATCVACHMSYRTR